MAKEMKADCEAQNKAAGAADNYAGTNGYIMKKLLSPVETQQDRRRHQREDWRIMLKS